MGHMGFSIIDLRHSLERLASVDTKLLGHDNCDRDALIALLEKCVSHREFLRLYLRTLQDVLNGRIRYNGATTVVRAKELADQGLACALDAELLALALDPVSLWTVHDV